MDNSKIADLIFSLTGADKQVVENYLDRHGLTRFMADSSTIEGISEEAKQGLDEVNLFLQEVSNAKD